MTIAPEHFAALEELSAKIAAELVFAEPDKDDGLIPAFSLIGELLDRAGACDPIYRAATFVHKHLGDHLDSGRPWDRDLIRALTGFSLWCETATIAAERGEPLPTFALAAPPAEAAPAAAEAAPAIEPDAVPAELLDLDNVQTIDLGENRELLAEFYTEAVDHLGQIESAVLRLETHAQDRDAINAVFRSFHSLKGGAGFLHLRPINRLAHEIESVLDDVRNSRLAFTPVIVDVVLAGRDTIDRLVAQVHDALDAGRQPSTAIPVSALIMRVRSAARREGEGAPPPAAPKTPAAAEAAPPPAPVSAPAAPVVAPAAVAAASAPAPQHDEAQTVAEAAAAAASRQETKTIRVQTGKLDSLMDLVGELVIAQSQLVEGAREAGRANSLHRTVGQLARISKELQHTAMSLRMIPIKPTFQKMARLVRDLALKAGKSVQFNMHGEDTELDRNMVEEIGDPLVHMIRNALDHGVEPPADRRAAGKPETGHITLRAFHQGGNIVVELVDDGRGIDQQRVLKKAIEKGLVSPSQTLSEHEIVQLIFLPGFSTAERVTDISGRGVGMDVVKRNIERLRGSIEIHTVLGKGSTFRVILPLTMAIIDGLVVRVGHDRFILPTTSVKLALRPKKEMLATIQGRAEVITLRDRTIPVVRLHRRFGIEASTQDLVDGTVVILDIPGKPCGLFVDEMVSKQEVVVKSLGSMMRNLPGIAGGAILGDGSIALILDPASLVKAA